jgi:hypothetical protein
MKTLLLFLLLPTLTFAQTNVSGFISANTTWTLAGSPYIVTGNVLLSHGFTLTIEPKVVVKFEDSTALQIDGELIAIGTSKDRITFTSNKVSPAPGDWAKIHFPDTCIDAVFDTNGNYVSGTIMKYCDVLYGGGVGFGEIHVVNSSPYFTHCNFLNSKSAGIYAYGGNYVMDKSAIKNCLGDGLYFTMPYGYVIDSFCSVTVQTDTIAGNMKYGIEFAGSNLFLCPNHTFKICNNYFVSNQKAPIRGPQTSMGFGAHNLLISENYFANNKGESIIEYPSDVVNYAVTCNKFLNNTTSQSGVLRFSPSVDGVISNNLFENNHSTSGPSICTIEIGGGSMYFRDNTITGNNSNNSPCCIFAPNLPPSVNWFVDHNNFINNSGLATVQISGNSNQPTGGNIIYLKFNNFINPNCQYEIYNQIAYAYSNLYVDSNYWGSTSTQHVDSVIYDYFDFANQSVVYYSPLLSLPAVIDTTCSLFILPTGVKNIEEQNERTVVKVYPNPFTNQFTVQLSENEQTTVSLYNFLGQQLLQQAFTNCTTINTQLLADGIYFYELRSNKGKPKTGKVVKQ